MSDEIGVLVAGYPALAKLNEHSDALDGCQPCRTFVAQLLRGADPKEVLYLRCWQAQEWQAAVDAALKIVKARTGG